MTLLDELRSPQADIDALADWLDGLSHDQRVAETRALDGSAQRRLWRLTRGRAIDLDDFVPPGCGPLDPVRHYGRNTLPAFRLFEKRFCRPPLGEDANVLWGYNEGVTRPLVGPGYFVVRRTGGDSRGESVIDYTQVPPQKPTDWPKIQFNERGLSRFVYAGMLDFMRRVSTHVSIGRAYRKDRETPNCFVLCREG